MDDFVRNVIVGGLGLTFVGLVTVGVLQGVPKFPSLNGDLKAAGEFGDPIQAELPQPKTLRMYGDIEVLATDTYEVEALVVGCEQYSQGTFAEMSPVDLLLAWGAAAAPPVVSQVTWRQSRERTGWFSYDPENLAISIDELRGSYSHNHIIPADEQVQNQILDVKRGDSVRLKGYLARARRNAELCEALRGRSDVGEEVLYVTSMEKLSGP